MVCITGLQDTARFIRLGVIIIYKYKIELVTNSDINEFVKIAASADGYVKLVDCNGFCVNGKSLLGAMATIEWSELYCISENDIYSNIQKFCMK